MSNILDRLPSFTRKAADIATDDAYLKTMPCLPLAKDEKSVLNALATGQRLTRHMDDWVVPTGKMAKDNKPAVRSLSPDVCRKLVDRAMVAPNIGQPWHSPELAESYIISALGRAALGQEFKDKTHREELLAWRHASPEVGDPVQDTDYAREIRVLLSNWRFRQAFGKPENVHAAWGWWSEFKVVPTTGSAKGITLEVVYNPKKFAASSQFEFFREPYFSQPTKNPGLQGYQCLWVPNDMKSSEKCWETPATFALAVAVALAARRNRDEHAAKARPEPPPPTAYDDGDDPEELARMLGIIPPA